MRGAGVWFGDGVTSARGECERCVRVLPAVVVGVCTFTAGCVRGACLVLVERYLLLVVVVVSAGRSLLGLVVVGVDTGVCTFTAGCVRV